MTLSVEDKKSLIRLIEAGVARGSEKIGKITKTEWDIATETTKEITEERFLIAANAGKEKAVGCRLSSESNLGVDVAVFFPETSARSLARAMLREHARKYKGIKNVLEAATGELSNVIAQSVIGAMADELNTSITLSVPKVGRGTKEELLCEFFAESDDPSKFLVMTHIELYGEDLSAHCTLVLLFDSKGLASLLAA